MSYPGLKGYRPVVATLKETPVAISYEFKEGNDNRGRLETVKKALGKIPTLQQHLSLPLHSHKRDRRNSPKSGSGHIMIGLISRITSRR